MFKTLLDGSLLSRNGEEAGESVSPGSSCSRCAADKHYSERRACSINQLLVFPFPLFFDAMFRPGVGNDFWGVFFTDVCAVPENREQIIGKAV